MYANCIWWLMRLSPQWAMRCRVSKRIRDEFYGGMTNVWCETAWAKWLWRQAMK